jgi:hypothetical protein
LTAISHTEYKGEYMSESTKGGRSAQNGKAESAQWVLDQNIKTALDVGPGRGTYSDLFQEHGISLDKLDAVEVWEPYVVKHNLASKYTNVFIEDIRKFDNFDYDLIIFGDVLEHMTKEEAISVWNKASNQARYAIISIPTVHYPQGEADGNPYEEHVKDDWTAQEVLDTFPQISSHFESGVVGVFFAKFR